MDHFALDGAEMEYQVRGEGEPVLLIHLGVIADGLSSPLFARPEIASRYRLIHYHRRGYMGSTIGQRPLTFDRQADDAAALLNYLGVKSAHVVGHSFGGNIALQLALDAPDLVHSLALLETPLPAVPNAQASLRETLSPMMEAYRSGDKRSAVDLFSTGVFGPDWQAVVEKTVPGGVEQAVKDVDAFMQELPAIQTWQFGPEQAARIRQPVLSLLGTYTSPFMKEGRLVLHSWFPQTEDSDIQSTHLLQMQDPKAVAQALAGFFSRHPMK